MSIRYILPKTAADTNKLIDTAIKSAGATRQRIQMAAIGCLYHAYAHGDYTPCGRLVLGLADTGIRRDSLVKFLAGYGGLHLNTDPATRKEKPFSGWEGKDYIKENFEEAKATMWDKVIEEKDPFVTADLQVALVTLIKKFNDLSAKAGKAGFEGEIRYGVSENIMLQLKQLTSKANVNTKAQDAKVMDALDSMLAGEVQDAPVLTGVA